MGLEGIGGPALVTRNNQWEGLGGRVHPWITQDDLWEGLTGRNQPPDHTG